MSRVLFFVIASMLIASVLSAPKIIEPKPGNCPVLPENAIGICADTCFGDMFCGGDLKCCRNGCNAFQCMHAVFPPEAVPEE